MAAKKLSDFPGVAAQLDNDRNNGTTADQITAGSHLKYWWRCEEGPDHCWQATPGRRTEKGTGCPACAGRQVSVTNSLAARHPTIAAQLDPELNGDVTADRILAGSHVKYWWRCDQGSDHVWETTASERTLGGRGCPSCSGHKVSVTNSLAMLLPELAAQLDSELNGDVTADQIVARSGKKFWWRCDKGVDHVWKTTAASRASAGDGAGCPACNGKQASATNCLATLYPEVAAQLDPDRNNGITANQIVAGSAKKFWWRCEKGPDHVWHASASSRTSLATGCPACASQQVSVTNSLATLNANVAAQLDPDRNNGITADQIVAGSGKKFWWRCDEGPDHVWKTTAADRSAGSGCPACVGQRVSVTNSLAALHPAIAVQLDPDRNNGVTADQIVAGSGKKFWWRCDTIPDHVWQASTASRTRLATGCPACCNQVVSATNCLATLYPKVAAQLDPDRNNGITADQIIAGSTNKKYWWRCDKGPDHVWQSTTSGRTSSGGHGCPACSRRQVSTATSLATLHPAVAAQLDPDRNNGVTADQISDSSNKKFWWRCDKGPDHVWQAPAFSRTSGRTGCPACSGYKVSVTNSLASLYPAVAAQLDPDRNNGITADQIVAGTNAKFWWRCDQGPDHIWRAAAVHRIRVGGSGCPRCHKGWTAAGLREFVRALLPHLGALSPAELWTVCAQNGLATSNRRDFAQQLTTGQLSREDLEKFVSAGDSPDMAEVLAAVLDANSEAGAVTDATQEGLVEVLLAEQAGDDPLQDGLPVLSVDAILAPAQLLIASADEEAAAFLVAARAADLWRAAYRDPSSVAAQTTAPREDKYQERILAAFRAEFDAARQLQPPPGWAFRPAGPGTPVVAPNLMQCHIAVQVRDRRRVGNWSGTGAGKTVSAVLTARIIGADLTVVVCPNNTVAGWSAAIAGCYPDARVEAKTLDPTWRPGAEPRWLVVNFEALQQPEAQSQLASLLEREQVDLVVVDEVHFAKARNADESLRRRNLRGLVAVSAKRNPDLAVLGMSATPVVNSLYEARSLLELIEGFELDDVAVDANVANAMAIHQRLVRAGTRWLPDYSAILETTIAEIDCGDYIDQVRQLGPHPHPAGLEQVLIHAKLPAIVSACAEGGKTLIYTEFVEDVVAPLRTALEAAGLRVGLFTGGNKTGLQSFLGQYGDYPVPKADQVEVLIGSSAIGTGVDGLQHVTSRLIFATLPWTAAGYQQVVGRIHRQGSTSARVNVLVPLTAAHVGGETWSWCHSRWDRIHYKRTLADAAVDGIVPEGRLVDASKVAEAAAAWLARLDAGGTALVERRILAGELDPAPASADVRIANYGDFAQLNQRWNTTRSGKTHERLAANPEEWRHYHDLYRQARATWPVVPAKRFAQWAQERRIGRVIADLGCGEMVFADAVGDRHQVLGFDHVAIDARVTACDITAVPLEDDSVDIVVLSLALMGVNRDSYIAEARRILPVDGQLWLAETTNHLGTDEARIRLALRERGFDTSLVEILDQFVLVRATNSERQPVNEPTTLFTSNPAPDGMTVSQGALVPRSFAPQGSLPVAGGAAH